MLHPIEQNLIPITTTHTHTHKHRVLLNCHYFKAANNNETNWEEDDLTKWLQLGAAESISLNIKNRKGT